MARDHLKLFLWLFPVPLLWIAFSTLAVFEDFYRPLANGAMNWRFRVRGPVEVPELKLIYATSTPRRSEPGVNSLSRALIMPSLLPICLSMQASRQWAWMWSSHLRLSQT